MKVLLASCSVEKAVREEELPTSSYPIGLGSIHSYLESKGHEVKTLFMNCWTEENCLAELERHVDDYDVLGLQILSHNRVCTYRAIEAFTRRIRIVIGGIHTSIMYEQIVEKYHNVIAVIGEGELTFAEILEGKPLADINGIAYWGWEMVEVTPPRELIQDLDALPFTKHEAFCSKDKVIASLMTSRGCPFNCSFCSLDLISRRKVRYRSPDNVVAELIHIKKILPNIGWVWIHDDSFFLDIERTIAICDRIEAANLGIKFMCSARFKPLSERLVKALERAGCIQVLMGLESGCQRILDRARKKITQYDVIKAFQLFKDSPIHVTAFLIVGLPGEDEESVDETWQFVNYLQSIKYTHYETIPILMVYPGTEIYELMKTSGKMTDDFWMTDEPVPFYTAEQSYDTLLTWTNRILDKIAYGRIIANDKAAPR